ncbi:SET domain-containing protein [Earliella scabrosa]|nr:SET domain-containing protein [Earliella scabrosa]
MSFTKLKSARKAKESHSFVNPETPTETRPGPPFTANTHDAIQDLPSSGQLTSSADAGTADNVIPRKSSSGTVAMDVDPPQASTSPPTDQSKAPSNSVSTTPVKLHDCHAALPFTVEIRESSRQGRGIYAKSAFSAGTSIVSVTPHVSVLSTGYLDRHCSACAGPAPPTGLKRCPKCKTLWYCNSECQNRDWTWHKRECSALQKWAAAAPSPDVAVPGDAVRCLGRILWGSQKEGLDSVWAKEIRMMHSNRSSLQPSAFESHTHMAHSVVRYLGVSSPQELEPYGLRSAGDLVDLISRFTTNTFTLTDPSLTPIGICIAPSVAFANHSCDPNAVIVFPRAPSSSPSLEPRLRLVALRDIALGKEIRISYVDPTLPKTLRQQELKEVYSFACRCKLCTRALPADPREALVCPKACGGICPHPAEGNEGPTRCVRCQIAISNMDAVLDALRVGQEALDKASSLQFKDPAKARQLTTNIIPILVAAGVTPSAHPLLALTRVHQELLIASLSSSLSQEALDETIRAAAKYAAGLQSVLPKGHPVRAVALAELGKLLAVDEPSPPGMSDVAEAGRFPPSGPARLKLAYEALVRAHEEVLVGFGKADGGGQLGRELRDAIVRLEKELGVWTTGIRNALEDTVIGQGASSSK